jgi:uncharacterized membrane protein
MADTVPSPQQPAAGSQNQTPGAAAESEKKTAPSMQEQASQQTQQAVQNAQQAVGQVQQTGQQLTQGAQQVMGQAGQVTGQAKEMLGQAASLLTSKPTEPQPPVTQEEKIWAALSYIPMVALVAFLIKPKSAFVKLHGRQGLLIFLIFFFSIFLYIILPPLGPILGGLVQFGMFVVGVFSIYQAIMGNWWKTPVLGNIADMLPVDMFTNVATQAITGQEPTQTTPEGEVAQPAAGQAPAEQAPTEPAAPQQPAAQVPPQTPAEPAPPEQTPPPAPPAA